MNKFKEIAAVILFILIVPHVSIYGENRFSVGAGVEANIITADDQGFSIGGLLNADFRFGPIFAAGIGTNISYDTKELFSVETRLFGRWYFFRPRFLEFFFQGDAGLFITHRGSDPRDSRGSPAVGLTGGTRILLPDNWYLEPYVRVGYPFKGGVGLLVGFSPFSKNKNMRAVQELQSGEELLVSRDIITVPEIAALAIEPYIYFASNTANFIGLDKVTVSNNTNLLKELAEFLNANSDYQLIIEGHANPVTNTMNEEKSLNPLSTERAEVVANTLISYGVDRKRLIIAGSGGAKVLIAWTDRDNWNLNRRVEFLLMRPASRTKTK